MRVAGARGSASLFIVVVALPLALVGLSIASEWSTMILVRRQAAITAEAAASAAASAARTDGQGGFDVDEARRRAEAVLSKAMEEVDYNGTTISMLRSDVKPPILSVSSPATDAEVIEVDITFFFPRLPIFDMLARLTGYETGELEGRVSRTARTCSNCQYILPRP